MYSDKSMPGRRARLLRLLHGEYDDSAALASEDVWQTAMKEGLVAVLWHAIQGRQLSAGIKHLVAPHLRECMAQTMRCRQVTGEVLEVAGRAEIPVLCLRGQAVAELLYEDAAMRPQTDVDILVHAADVHKLGEALRSLGFAPTPLYPMLYERGQVLLDTHTDIIGISRIASRASMTSLRSAEFFRYAKQGSLCGQSALLLESRVLLPYLCLHALKHSFDRLIWLWDIALLARRVEREEGWPAVIRGIRGYRLERPCFYALSYAHKYMDAPVPAALLRAMPPAMDWRETSLFARFMAHETVPYLAERLFARMMPDRKTRMAFWYETVFPKADVREQFAGAGDCPGCNFIRDRLKRLCGMFLLAWREARALFHFRA